MPLTLFLRMLAVRGIVYCFYWLATTTLGGKRVANQPAEDRPSPLHFHRNHIHPTLRVVVVAVAPFHRVFPLPGIFPFLCFLLVVNLSVGISNQQSYINLSENSVYQTDYLHDRCNMKVAFLYRSRKLSSRTAFYSRHYALGRRGVAFGAHLLPKRKIHDQRARGNGQSTTVIGLSPIAYGQRAMGAVKRPIKKAPSGTRVEKPKGTI